MGFHNKDELICCFDTHTFISVLQQQIAVQNALEVLRTKSLNGVGGGLFRVLSVADEAF